MDEPDLASRGRLDGSADLPHHAQAKLTHAIVLRRPCNVSEAAEGDRALCYNVLKIREILDFVVHVVAHFFHRFKRWRFSRSKRSSYGDDSRTRARFHNLSAGTCVVHKTLYASWLRLHSRQMRHDSAHKSGKSFTGIFALAGLMSISCSAACAQWSLDGSAPMRIPSLEELGRPLPPIGQMAPTPIEDGKPLTPFLNDSTLRRGDIVVTPDGAMTYQGGGGNRRQEDFSPLDLPAARPQAPGR